VRAVLIFLWAIVTVTIPIDLVTIIACIDIVVVTMLTITTAIEVGSIV
jgi:hypothetical protein